ncbi:phage tail spike protein [Soonwooa purpurea]
MGEIVVNQKGTELSLNALSPLSSIVKAEHVQELMSLDRLEISIQSNAPIQFYIGDFIEHEGRRFTLNLNPKVNKQSESKFQYDLVFEGVQYDLIRKVYFNYDASGNYTTGDFPLTGNIHPFLVCLINNANRDKKPSDFTWILGDFPANTDTKTITFSNTNSLAALQTICKDFELEFDIVQNIQAKTNTLHIRNVGVVLPFTFEYGYKNGLYSLRRENVSDAQVTTRLYPLGSTENIPTNYRDFSPRLKMPTSYGKDYIQDDAKVDLYGLNEEIINYDDIKPTFKGILSAVGTVINNNNTFDIVVSNIDFDLNETKPDGSTKYLIPGTPARIHVNKGNLAGYDFEIHKYVHATKTLTVKQFADERGQKFPDLATVFKFAIGDEITLLDIIMPQSYVDIAEAKLRDKAIEDYAKKSQNNVKYSLDIDPMFFVELGYTEFTKIIGIGDYANVKDSQLLVNKQSRIISLRRDMINLLKYSAEISDTYEIGIVTQIFTEINTINTQIQSQSQISAQAMLSGYRRMMELQGMVFDTDGKFDMDNFAAGSITTTMLSVGATSQQLTLKDVIFTPNKDGNVNNISISAGSLIHFSIDPSGIKTWNLSALNMTGLLPSQSYYIYARCARSTNVGTFIVTTEQRKFDQEDKQYNFLLGVLFQPQNGVRLIHLNYGASFINGRVITTGKITSIDGLNWFDLDTGEFRGKFIFTDGSNVQTSVNNASNAAAAAQATANSAISQINDIGSDNKLTPSEKQTLVVEWNRIQTEYSQNSSIATTLGLAITTYQNAYNTLNSYITPLLSNLTITSDIVGTTFRANFQSYYTQNVSIVTLIENKKIENIQVGGRNYYNKTIILENDGLLTRTENDFKIIGKSSGNSQIRFKKVINSDGYWTVSGFVKNTFGENLTFKVADFSSPYQSFSFVGDGEWKRFEMTFNIQGYSNSLNFLDFAGIANSEYIFEKIKIEKGNKSTDWTPAPEDVQAQIDTNTINTATALAQANNAINTANNVANLTSFLQTSIQGNVVGTGTLLVGDVLGANAMICGVTDRPNGESIRFGAGKPYDQKYNSPFQVLDNGMVRFVNPSNGQTTFQLGYNQNTGKVVFDIYNESGIKVATIGPNGIEFTGYIPESYKKYNLRKLITTSFIKSDIESEMQNKLTKFLIGQAPPPITPDNNWRQYNIGSVTNYTAYSYYEGRNFESADNAQYAGFYPTANKFDSHIPNGIYVRQFILENQYTGNLNGNPINPGDSVNYPTEAWKIEDGKIIGSIIIYINTPISSTATRSTDFPIEDYEQ